MNMFVVSVILVFDFVISLWNGYAAGFSTTRMKTAKSELSAAGALVYLAGYVALLLSFVGMAYVLSIVFGFVAVYMEYITMDILELLLAYNFLVFGGLITAFGVLIAIESIVVAYYTRRKADIAVSIYNTFASIWNVFTYVRNFGVVKSMIKSGNDSARTKAILLIILAVIIAFILTWSAFRMGQKAALRAGQANTLKSY